MASLNGAHGGGDHGGGGGGRGGNGGGGSGAAQSKPDVSKWGVDEVCSWVARSATLKLDETVIRAEEITGILLLQLEDADLVELGVTSGLQRKKILNAIKDLAAVAPPSASRDSKVQEEEDKVRKCLKSLGLPEAAINTKIAAVNENPPKFATNKVCGELAKAILGANAKTPAAPVPTPRFKGNCDNCGKHGHRARDCTDAKSEFRVNRTASPAVKGFDRFLKNETASISCLRDAQQFSLQNPTYTTSTNGLYLAVYKTPGLLETMITHTNRAGVTADLICSFAITVASLLADARDDIMLRNLETKLAAFRCKQADRLSRLLRPAEYHVPGKISKAMARPGGRHCNDHEDYRRVALIPIPAELDVKDTPYLPLDADANRFLKDEEAHVLDKQFRLLREDLVDPLKHKLAETLSKPTDLLHNARFVGADLFPQARIYLQFQAPKKLSKVKDKEEFWDDSRLLQYGTVVGLFQIGEDGKMKGDPLFGRVADRDSKRLAKDQTIGLMFEDQHLSKPLSWINDASKSSMVLVEISASFFSYEPILKCLQQMNFVPFADEVVYMKPSRRIEYAKPAALKAAMASELRKHPFELDASQQDAVDTALQNRVSLIQGPPGTGKSFIGGLIANALLKATKEKILCVCYTNHALDQFLEALHDSGERSIVRLGNSSKSEKVKEYELRNLTKKVDFPPEAKEQWYRINQDMQKLEAEFKQFKGFMAMDDLIWRRAKDYLDAKHPKLLSQFAIPHSTPGFKVAGPAGKELKPDDIWYRWKTGGVPYAGMSGGTLWDLNFAMREHTFRAWLTEIKQAEAEKCASKMKEHQKLTKMKNEIRNLDDRRVLEQARVIGCTTHGAATRKEMLQVAGAKILIVEEAAEVLEAHVLTSIGRSIEHLIMIGDHKQLRPKADCYKLRIEAGKGYGLNRSLFERMVDCGFKLSTLTQQHRMRPEISSLVRLLTYPKLVDGSKVAAFPPLRGAVDNVIFLHHTEEEAHARDAKSELDLETNGKSKSNTFEAQMCASIVKYFLQQGYKPSQLVVLATYKDQLRLLQASLKKCHLDTVLGDLDVQELEADGDKISIGGTNPASAESIRVATVDNYQGEEADVVIASFVRSNPGGIIGHLNEARRINVLLSRARHGLVMIGNIGTMLESARKKSRADPNNVTQWHKLFDALKSRKAIFEGFPAVCQQHPGKKMTVLKTPQQFNHTCPDGGCTELCSHVFECGHKCPKKCHPLIDGRHTGKCKSKCQHKLDCGHDCQEMCHPVSDGKHATLALECTVITPHPCEECSTLLPAECWQVAQNRVEPCSAFCSKTLDCGHACDLRCHPTTDGHHTRLAFECNELMLHTCTKCNTTDVVECWRVQKKDFEFCNGCVLTKATEKQHMEEVAQLARLAQQKAVHARQKECRRRAEADANKIAKQTRRPFKKEQLEKRGATLDEYYQIEDRVMRYMQPEHGFIKVKRIEKIINDQLLRNWHTAKAKMIDPEKDPRLLFHGTSADVTDLIAKGGFKLPAKGQGNMFGQGIYLATDSTKSANPLYTKDSNRLLVCDTLLGKSCAIEGWSKDFPLQMHMEKSTSGTNRGKHYLDVDLKSVRRKGFDSVFAPRGCSGAGGVKFDEMIVYDPRLVLPKYIVHFSNSRGGDLPRSGSIPSFKVLPKPKHGQKHSIVSIRAGRFQDPDMAKEYHFRMAESQLLRMYAKVGQRLPGKVVTVEVIVNMGLQTKYERKKASMKGHANEIFAFHGGTEDAYASIASNNFDIGRLAANTGNRGFYGAGIYFSEFPNTARGYAKTSRLLLSRVLVGNAFECPGLMMGAPLKAGCDSHRSPDKTEIVIYNGDQILPSYIVGVN
eukprot:gene11520-30653_t